MADTDENRPKGLTSAICYVDANSAFKWLETAFGFEPFMILLDENDQIAHSEMKYGDSYLMVGNEWSADHKSPQSIHGKNTQTVHVQLAEGEDIDAHCERARKAGAEIMQEPATQFYGDRSYRARDPEGHIWTFGVTVKFVPPEAWAAAGAEGLRLVTRL